MSYSIVTDTSANLPTPILEAANVPVIPFHYTYNDAEHACLDTEAFDGKLYYDAIRGGTSVSTSQINPQAYIDCFEPLLDAGQDILFHADMDRWILCGSSDKAELSGKRGI